jgi:hypothetical protein
MNDHLFTVLGSRSFGLVCLIRSRRCQNCIQIMLSDLDKEKA